MKTGQLIGLLAAGAGPAPRRLVAARIRLALAAGALTSVLGCLLTLGGDAAVAVAGQPLALKLAYVLGLLVAAAWWMERMARPAAAWQGAAAAVLVVVALMAARAGVAWSASPVEARVALLLGDTWQWCSWRVAALSLPALALALWAMSGLAPTRLRLAGFAAGLSAGGAGAFGYTLFCHELSPAFVLIWYSLGMLVPALAGAWLGPRLLRW